MNSITIATKSSGMEIRLQTAVIQPSKPGSNPKAIACETRGQVWEKGAPKLIYSAPPPIHLHFPGLLRVLTCQRAGIHACWELEKTGRHVELEEGAGAGLRLAFHFLLCPSTCGRGTSRPSVPLCRIRFKTRSSGVRLFGFKSQLS